MKTKSTPLYINKIHLWKKNVKGKWVEYALSFDNIPDSYSYQRAIRLMKQGWIPYAPLQKPGTHQPLNIDYENADTSLVSNKIKESDPIGVIIGDAMREFLFNHSEEAEIEHQQRLELERKQKMEEIEFQKIKERLADNRPVPKHLLDRYYASCTA